MPAYNPYYIISNFCIKWKRLNPQNLSREFVHIVHFVQIIYIKCAIPVLIFSNIIRTRKRGWANIGIDFLKR